METKNCTSKSHRACKSPHPKDSVPINLFYINGQDESKGLYKQCLNCRIYIREVKLKRFQAEEAKANEVKANEVKANEVKANEVKANECKIFNIKLKVTEVETQVEVTEVETKACKCSSHGVSGSPHSKNAVPITLFYKNKIYDQKGLYEYCLDCRTYCSDSSKARKAKKKNSEQDCFLQNAIVPIIEKETKTCKGPSHNKSGSAYPKYSVPINFFYKNRIDRTRGLTEHCIDCNKYAYKLEKARNAKKKALQQSLQTNVKSEELNESNYPIIEGETKVCGGDSHGSSGSIYPKNHVPINLFYKNGVDETGGITKSCLDCRGHFNEKARDRYAKTRMVYNEMNQKLEVDGYKVCENSSHDNCSGSLYDKYKVPISMFMKDPNDIRAGLHDSCYDCIEYDDYIKRKSEQKKMELALNSGTELCSGCFCELTILNYGYNKDGSRSKCCDRCKARNRNNKTKLKEFYHNLKLECVIKNHTSCMLCDNIFIKAPNYNPPFTKLPIIIENNIKYVNYNNEIITVEFFLNNYKDLLELTIMEFDHLPENEFNYRYPNKIFVPKKDEIRNLSSELQMSIEVSKCQHLCGECHMKETIRR